MIKMLKPYRMAIMIALCLTLIELIVELFQPYLIAKIIDDGIIASRLQVIYVWGGMLLVTTLVSFTSGIINSFYSAHVSHSYGYDLREKLYEKVQSLSYAVFNRLPASSYITRLTSDIAQVQNTVFMALRIMIRAPLMVVGSLIMAFVVNPKLAVYLLLSVPVLVVFVAWVMKTSSYLFGKVQAQLDRLNGFMQENLIGMRLIRAFHREKRMEKQFNHTSEALAMQTQSVLRLTETLMPVILFMMNLGIMAVLWFGGKHIVAGSSSVGDVVAIINYAMRMTGALSMLSWIIAGYSRARASAARITEVLQEEEGIADRGSTLRDEDKASGRIAFAGVSLRYPEAEGEALSNISFEVQAGQTVAFLGATGSGKSTLFRLIPRLYEADSGLITIDGIDIRKLPLDDLRHLIGYVPQDTMLFSGTIRDNIAWGKTDATLEEIEQAARDAQIHETILKLPKGYDTMVGQRGINLSGGQKQRISIARALVRRPRILLLDDSTSALDMRTEAALLRSLSGYSCTTLMITQKISTAVHADAIILLDEGRVLAQGRHETLLESSALYRKIVESQVGKEGRLRVERTS